MLKVAGRPARREVARANRVKGLAPLAVWRMSERPIAGTMVSRRSPPEASVIPTRRFVSIASGTVAFLALAGWLALAWDALVTNFQVRWMCDEDRAFVNRRAENVDALALPDDAVQGDARVLPVFSEAFPTVALASTPEGRAARFALIDRWPKRIRSYWGYGVVRSELSVVEIPGNRALGTSGLYRRVALEGVPFAQLRARLSPPAELCTPADRIEFVKRVLKPPA